MEERSSADNYKLDNPEIWKCPLSMLQSILKINYYFETIL
jgi:hypothetical protein